MALSELLNIAKYSSGYHGDGAFAPSTKASQDVNTKQQTALKLLQLKALLETQQANAAIAKRKQDLWNTVGTPAVSDKSTAGDVTKIVDDEEVGGRDAGVVNDGKVAMDAQSTASIPSDTQSNSSLVNMMKGLQPVISQAGNMILSKPKQPKPVDHAKTFSYAQRLADQAIIQSGKTKKDVSPQDYAALINNHIPDAEKSLYGKSSTPADQFTQDTNTILSRPKQYNGVAKNYDEARTFNYAKRLADQSIIQSGKKKKDISDEDYKTLVNDNIPSAEKYLYGRALSQPAAAPDASATPADATGITKAIQVGLDAGASNTPAPGEKTSAPQAGSYTEGQTAINPKTGKRLQFKAGKWQALN